MPAWMLPTAYALAANVPDLDFIPGLLLGDLSRFHHGPSHSIGFAIVFALVASLLCSRRLQMFLTALSLYLSHVLLDYLVHDPSTPHGVPLLWPMDHEYYMAPFAFLRSFDYLPNSSDLRAIIVAFITPHNLLTVATEVLILAAVLGFVGVVKTRMSTRGFIAATDSRKRFE
jgi:inner membrane protein